jgi:glycosyltransferase involved in cell wall biosynthesis
LPSAEPLKVLIVSPQCDAHEVGEAWDSYHWIVRLSEVCRVTLLTLRVRGRIPPSQQLPATEVIEWERPPYTWPSERFSSLIKPWYVPFYLRARRWIGRARAVGRRFDLIHQLMPLAMRYPSPGVGMGMPFMIGPLAGSLETPPAFAAECASAPLFTRLRALDGVRLRYDPLLRRTYSEADLVLGSSPYVGELLSVVPLKRFEVLCEVAIDGVVERKPGPPSPPGHLRLLYVGRVVRTKGLRDAVRALARLPDLPNVTLDAVGGGEDLAHCRSEAEQLGLADRITFHGRLPPEAVDAHYEKADVFLFPSFREPTGIVLFEAMRHGLAVITTDRGGPGHIVDDRSGIRVPVTTPQQFADDLAEAIRLLAIDKARLSALREGARERVQEIGSWPNKINAMLTFYRELAGRVEVERAHGILKTGRLKNGIG